jgi:hypothetical protein
MPDKSTRSPHHGEDNETDTCSYARGSMHESLVSDEDAEFPPNPSIEHVVDALFLVYISRHMCVIKSTALPGAGLPFQRTRTYACKGIQPIVEMLSLNNTTPIC